LAAGEEFLADGVAVGAIEQRLAHTLIGEHGVLEIDLEVLVAEARLVEHGEAVAVALLEGERLVERKTEFARHHVEAAGEQVRLERRGVLHRPDDDTAEGRRLPPPGGIALEHDMRAG